MGRRNTGSIRYLTNRGKWQVRVTDPQTGKRRSVTVDTEAEARDILERAQARIASQPKTFGRMNLARYIPQWLEEHEGDYAPKSWTSTVGRLEKHLLPHPIAEIELADLRPTHFHQLLNRELKSKGLAYNTRRNIKSDISCVLRSALKEGHLKSNPIRDLDIEGRSQDTYYKFSASDLALLLHDPRIPKHRRLRYQITFYLGQRANDIWGIKLRDIDLAGGLIKIWCSKQQTLITYSLLPPVIEAIKDWMDHLRRYRSNPEGLLFPSKATGRRRKVSSSNPIRQLRIDCEKVGIVAAPNSRITWHSWRGSLSTALQAGTLGERWTAEEAARQLGHRSAQTTRRHYTEQAYVYPVAHMQAKAARVGVPAPPSTRE